MAYSCKLQLGRFLQQLSGSSRGGQTRQESPRPLGQPRTIDLRRRRAGHYPSAVEEVRANVLQVPNVGRVDIVGAQNAGPR